MAAKPGDPRRRSGGGPALVQPTIRTNFADTALWVAALTTEKDGTANVELNMPENLTTWRIKVWGMGQGTRVGEGATDVVTRKDLIIRMQTPRFFVQKDEVVLSANVHNYLKNKKSVKVALEVEGNTLKPHGRTDADGRRRRPAARRASIGASRRHRRGHGHRPHEGPDGRRLRRDGNEAARATSTACSRWTPTRASSGPKDETGKFTVTVPQERRPKQSRLEVRYSPTLAGAMVDALPYLVDYPYGCTEQTLNRFLPTVLTQKILIEMGIDLEEIKKKQTNLNAQEIGDDTERAKQWQRYNRNPVFDSEEVKKMVKDGVERLTQMQLTDGGWGWFSGWGEHSAPHTTALVVHGLSLAKQNDVALVPDMLERGVEWLKRHQNEQVQLLKNAAKKDKPPHWRWKDAADNLDAFVYMVLVDEGVKNDEMNDFLYRDRTKLSVYSLGMFGLALHKQGDKEKLDMVMQNISQFVEQDDENQTAWLRLPDGSWWYWYGSEWEAHAYYLKLLGEDRSQGRTRPAAGQVPVEQPQARDLLELDPRHGDLCRGDGRLHAGQRRVEARLDGRNPLRRQAAKGRRDHAQNALHLRQQVRRRRREGRAGQARDPLEEERRRAALLQRLHDQLHAGGLHHQGRAWRSRSSAATSSSSRPTRA